jgi:hypothetical protein
VRYQAAQQGADSFDDHDIVGAVAAKRAAQSCRGAVRPMARIATGGAKSAASDNRRMRDAIAHFCPTASASTRIEKVRDAGAEAHCGQQRGSIVHVSYHWPRWCGFDAVDEYVRRVARLPFAPAVPLSALPSAPMRFGLLTSADGQPLWPGAPAPCATRQLGPHVSKRV